MLRCLLIQRRTSCRALTIARIQAWIYSEERSGILQACYVCCTVDAKDRIALNSVLMCMQASATLADGNRRRKEPPDVSTRTQGKDVSMKSRKTLKVTY